jgi:hypothetical protein
MDSNYTHIVILLDRSGSMGHLRNDVIGGVNNFIAEQRKLPGRATVTLAQFDNGPYHQPRQRFSHSHTLFSTPMVEDINNDGYLVNYSFLDINHVKGLDENTYVPRGGTALRDSFAKLIDDTGAELSKLPEDKRPGRVIFVVQTDGEENSSIRVSNEELKQRVTHQTEQYNWQFIFMGANIDSFAAAKSYGISTSNTAQFAHDSAGTQGSYMATSNLVSMKRSCDAQLMSSVAYTDEDRALAAGNKGTKVKKTQNTP